MPQHPAEMATGKAARCRNVWARCPSLRWPRFVGQLGGLIKVYSGCRSCHQHPFGSIFLPLLLRLWGCGQGA